MKKLIPQIFIGASSSNNIGYERKISLLFIHKPLISDSVKFTGFPDLEPLESTSFSIILY